MENDLVLLVKLIGASAYVATILQNRRHILGFCFKFTEKVKANIVLSELDRVEEARGYKLIPKGFLSRKSVTTILVLLY
jgi:hypothetical protein